MGCFQPTPQPKGEKVRDWKYLTMYFVESTGTRYLEVFSGDDMIATTRDVGCLSEQGPVLLTRVASALGELVPDSAVIGAGYPASSVYAVYSSGPIEGLRK